MQSRWLTTTVGCKMSLLLLAMFTDAHCDYANADGEWIATSTDAVVCSTTRQVAAAHDTASWASARRTAIDRENTERQQLPSLSHADTTFVLHRLAVRRFRRRICGAVINGPLLGCCGRRSHDAELWCEQPLKILTAAALIAHQRR